MIGDDIVISNKTLLEVKARIRGFAGQPDRKILEIEILKNALDMLQSKSGLVCTAVETGEFAMKTGAEILRATLADLHGWLTESAQPCRCFIEKNAKVQLRSHQFTTQHSTQVDRQDIAVLIR